MAAPEHPFTDPSHELIFPPFLEKPVKHYAQTITVTFHHFYIVGQIDDKVDRYIDMINTIKMAEMHDKIYICLNTPGGSLQTTIQIISAMQQSQAEIITVLEGEVSSAGTIIFLSGHNHIVNDNCSFMIHNISSITSGKGAEVRSSMKFMDEYFKKIAHSVYKDFLTDDEINDVLNDKDIWMDSEEVKERLKKRGFTFEPLFDSDIEDIIVNDEPTKKTKIKRTPKK